MRLLQSSTAVQRRRRVALLAAPQRWPPWPFLPVVRAGEGGSLQLGVVYDARGATGTYGFSATVFLVNLFLLPRRRGGVPCPATVRLRHLGGTAGRRLDPGRIDVRQFARMNFTNGGSDEQSLEVPWR